MDTFGYLLDMTGIMDIMDIFGYHGYLKASHQRSDKHPTSTSQEFDSGHRLTQSIFSLQLVWSAPQIEELPL